MSKIVGFILISVITLLMVIASSLNSNLFKPIIGLIEFKNFDQNNVAEVLTILMLVAVFFERALEVYVLTFRNNEKNQDSEEYKKETRKITLWSALFGGILISIVGVRGLESFANIPKNSGGWQYFYFRIIDISLTGALIAGGSDVIHKILQVFTTFTEAIAQSNKANAASSQFTASEMDQAAIEKVDSAAQTATEQATAAQAAAAQAVTAAQTATEQATAAQAAAAQAAASLIAIEQITPGNAPADAAGQAASGNAPTEADSAGQAASGNAPTETDSAERTISKSSTETKDFPL